MVRDLAVAEEAHERDVAQTLADHPEFARRFAEEALAAREAREVQRAARPREESALDAVEHARHVFLGGPAIAAAEHHLVAGVDEIADRDEPAFGVEADDVAHRVVGDVVTRDGDGREHEFGDAVEIAVGLQRGFLPEHVEGGAAVEFDQHVALTLRHGVQFAERRAALRVTRRDDDLVGEHDPGHAALGQAVRDLRMLASRAGESADDEAAFEASRHLGDERGRATVARIGVDDGEVARRTADRQRVAGEVGRRTQLREHAERARLEGAEHHRHRAFVEVLLTRRADADPDGPDPVIDAGAHAQQLDEVLEAGRVRVGDVQEAQVGAGRGLSELLEAFGGRDAPVWRCSVRIGEGGAGGAVRDGHGQGAGANSMERGAP